MYFLFNSTEPSLHSLACGMVEIRSLIEEEEE